MVPLTLTRLVIVVALLATACSQEQAVAPDPTIGFILIGARDDLGYNQAIWEASLAVERAFPDATVIRHEHVPEDDTAVDVMEELVAAGATVIFATSFGHGPMARTIAQRHPDVVVVHQGGIEGEPDLPNLGTYFGAHEQVMYVAGIAAGAAMGNGHIGFLAAFPIPATYSNVNALMLGARETAPDPVIEVAFLNSWCDPVAQEAATTALIARGADVIAMHQDCTGRILEVAEAAGVATIGYHYDGREVAPTTFLTAAVWSWDDLFADIVASALSGNFATSIHAGDYRGTLADGNTPFLLADPGPAVAAATAQRMSQALDQIRFGEFDPFVGPIVAADGTQRVPAGSSLKPADFTMMDWFVAGVVDVTEEVSR